LEPSIIKTLIVDDNTINQKVMSHLLKAVGYSCQVVSSGEEAVEFIKSTKEGDLDVIFLDIFMPGIGGIEAFKRIKSITNNWTKGPVVIACTADTSETTISKCIESGITRFIPKPVQRKAIANLLQELQQAR
jgi:CheY-like chemotaxis protein